MPATFKSVEKFCENCGNVLKLNCTRDLSRKRFCSRKCNRSFVTKELWKNPNFREKTIQAMNTLDANQKKGQQMNTKEAIHAMIDGKKVYRKSWKNDYVDYFYFDGECFRDEQDVLLICDVLS